MSGTEVGPDQDHQECCQRTSPEQTEMSSSMLTSTRTQGPVPSMFKEVCLIYTEDHDYHISVVNKLAFYLQFTFGISVQLASVTTMQFHHEQFSNALNIIINSSILGILFENSTNISDMNFICYNFKVVSEIKKNNVISVYFDYTEECRIPHDLFMENKLHFKLMETYSQFHNCLQENLHLTDNTVNLEQQKHLLQLHKEVSSAKEFQKSSPDWISAFPFWGKSLDGSSYHNFISHEDCSLCQQSIAQSEYTTQHNMQNCLDFRNSLENEQELESLSLGGTDI